MATTTTKVTPLVSPQFSKHINTTEPRPYKEQTVKTETALKQLSGRSITNPAGLIDITGEKTFINKTGGNVIMRADTFDALSTLTKNITDSSKTTKAFDPTWKPAISAAFVHPDYNTSGYVHDGQTVGRTIAIDLTGLSEAQRKNIFAAVDSHKKFIPVTSSKADTKTTDSLLLEYVGDKDTRAPLEATDREADTALLKTRQDGTLASDYDISRQNEQVRAKQKELKESALKTPTSSDNDASIVVDTNAVTPAKWISADGTVAKLSPVAKAHTLSSALSGTAVSTLRVVPVASTSATESLSKVQQTKMQNHRKGKLAKNYYDGTGNDITTINSGVEAKLLDKKDVPAQIQIYSEEKDPSKFTPEWQAFNGSTVGYIDCFLLRSVQARREERYFVFQSLYGDITTFFFGERPVVYAMQGVLIDTRNQQWLNDFEHYYENYIRGSKSVLNKTKICLVYEDQIIEGYVLNMTMSKSAEQNVAANFSFDMLLVNKTHINGYMNPVERNAVKPSIADWPAMALHRAKLLYNNVWNSLFASKDTTFDNKSGVYAIPTISTEDLVASTNEEARVNTTETVVDSIGGADLRGQLFASKSGDMLDKSIDKRTVDDLTPTEKIKMQTVYNTNGIKRTIGS